MLYGDGWPRGIGRCATIATPGTVAATQLPADGVLAALAMAYALALALVHLLVGKLPFIDAVPRSRWLSIAGGVSVAYVFVHILPRC